VDFSVGNPAFPQLDRQCLNERNRLPNFISNRTALIYLEREV
jgi:hypothetical protein